MLYHIRLFFYAVFSVFLTAQWQLRHTGSSGLALARNHLGTPGGAKSFPRGAQIF